MTEHPITPPPELVEQWRRSGPADAAANNAYERHIATKAAQWGADMELEACCVWVSQFNYDDYSYQERLQAARRRSKPLTLKEQALAVITNAAICDHLSPEDEAILRRALEVLDD